MDPKFYLKSLLGALLLCFLSWLGNQLIGHSETSSINGWNVLANFLIALVIGFYIIHSSSRAWKLTGIVFITFFIIGYFNILIEAMIFNVTDRSQTLKELLVGFLSVAIFSPLYVYLHDRWEGQSKSLEFVKRSPFSWIWRILLSDFLYFIFYAIAGFTLQAVYPQLLEFYEGKIPPFSLIIPTQFLRGFIFVAIAFLVLKTSPLSRSKKAVLIGLLFSILGGIAPLISPNAHMPAYIRWGHGFEVGVSNFLYGLTIGFLLGQQLFSKDVETNTV